MNGKRNKCLKKSQRSKKATFWEIFISMLIAGSLVSISLVSLEINQPSIVIQIGNQNNNTYIVETDEEKDPNTNNKC